MRLLALSCAAVLTLGILHGAEAPPEAVKYYDMLHKRPQFGVVFDRFVDTWLGSGTSDELRDFLTGKAGAPAATAADHLLLALFHTRQGNEPEALAAFTKALQLEPANTSAWMERARLETRMLDFNAALKSLDAALAQKPEEKLAIDLAKLRGRVLLRTGKPEDALSAWRELLKARPDDEDLAEEVVDLQLDEGLTAEAADTMGALIGRTRDAYARVSRQLRLAEILLRAGNKAAALTQLATCLAQSGRDTWLEGEILSQIEQVFRREDNLTGLVDHLSKLGAGEEPRVAVQRQLARLLAETGSKDKALAAYVALLERTPGRRDLRESYLDLLERFEKFADAIAQTNLLIEQNPGDKELQLRLATAHQRAGDPKAADAALAAYLAAKGTGEFDHLRVARLLEQWTRNNDAKEAYVRMVAAFPQSTSAREAQAHFLHRIGEKENALAIWRDLAAKGNLEELLAVAQALLARLEPKTAYEVMKARHGEFAQESRFLAPLITAALLLKEEKTAVPWALGRVRLTLDAAILDDAIRQALEVLEGAKEIESTLATLNALPSPTFSERALLAGLLEESGDRDASEKTLRSASPEEAVLAQTRLVRLIESRQDWLRAADELQKLITMPGGRTSQHVQRLVDLRQRAGDVEAALKLIPEWKTLSPGAAQPWLTEALLLTQLSRSQEAIKLLRAASRKFEDDDNIASTLAIAYADAGQFADAERIFLGLVEKADALDEKLRWVAALAQTAQTRGMLKAVTQRFEERQRTNRADVTPWLALAEIHRTSENKAEQKRCLEEALRLRPQDQSLLNDIARVEEDLGDWKAALRTLEKAAALDTTPRTKQSIAVLQLRWGDESQAFRILIDLFGGAQMDPKDAIKLADAMMGRDQWAKAIEFLDPFITRTPTDYRFRYLRAIARSEQGNTAGGLEDFLQIANGTTELPEVLQKRKLSPAANMRVWYEQFEKNYPPGMRQLMEITQGSYSARQHTYRRRQGGQQGAGSGVLMPASVEEARNYAMIHLVILSRDEKPENRKRLLEDLKAAGWTTAEPLFALELDEQRPWSMGMNEEVLKAHPNDLLMHAAFVTLSGFGEGTAVSVDVCKQAFELFKDKYPMLCGVAGNLAVRSDPKTGLPVLEAAIKRMEESNVKAEGEYNFFYYFLSSLLGGGQRVNQESRVDLPEPLRKRLCALLVASAKPSEGSKPLTVQNVWAFSSLVHASNALRAEHAWEDYIKLWDAQFATMRKADPATRKAIATWTTSSMPSNAQPPLFEPLEFPPICGSLPGLFAVMMRYEDPFNTHVEQWHRAGPEDDYAAAGKLLDTVKDPVMRLVLAYKAGQTARVESELTARLALPQVDPNDLLLAASYYSSKAEHARAAELLLRCVSGPMDASLRLQADAALVLSVISMQDSQRQALSAEAMTAAQQAARRLRSGKLTPAQREELGGALAKLGLKEEAEQWKRLAAAVPAPITVAGRTGTSQPRPDRIDTLIRQKAEPETILRAVIQEMKTIQSNYGRGNQRYAKQQVTSLIAKLTFTDARKKLVALLEPGDGAGEARKLESATMLDLLGETEKSLSIYESLVKDNPRQAEARNRLVLLTAVKSPEKAAAMILETPWDTMGQGTGAALVVALQANDVGSFAARMSVFESLAQYLDKLATSNPALPKGATEWALHLVDAASNYDNEASLPSLYYRRQEGYRPEEKNKARRRAVHDQVCRAVMKHPDIAAEGFRGLVGLAMHEKQDLAPFVPIAENLLREAAKHRAGAGSFKGAPLNWNWSDSRENQFWRPEPAEFLVWQAWKSDNPARIESEIFPLAEPALTVPVMKALRAQAALWTCAPADFASTASAFAKAQAPLNQYRSSTFALMDTLDCWQERNLPAEEMEKFFLQEMKRNSGSDSSEVISYFLTLRANRKESYADIEASFKRICLGIMGPETGWSKRLNDTMDYRYGRGANRRWDQAAYAILNTVEALMRTPEASGAGLKFAAMLGLLKHENWRLNNADTSMEHIAASTENVMDFLPLTPFFAEAPGFELWGGGATDRGSSPLIRLVAEIKSRKAVLDGVRQSIRQRQPRTFGVEFVQCMLEDNPSGPLSTLLKTRASELKTIPETHHVELARLITSLIPAVKQSATLDPALKTALEPLMASQFKSQEQRYEAWMKAAKLADLNASDSSCENEITRIVADLALRDRAKAAAFFQHACKLIEAKEALSEFDARDAGNGWTVRSDILNQVLDTTPKIETLRLSLKLYEEDTTGKLTMHGWSDKIKWGTSLYDLWKSAGGMSNHATGLQAVVDRLHNDLGGTPPTLVSVAFYDFIAKLPQNFRVPTLRWAAQPPQHAAQAPYLTELAMATRFFLATENGMRTNAEVQKSFTELGGVSPVWEHALASLKDEKRNPRARLALAHHLCYRAPLTVTPEIATAAEALAYQALKEGHCITGYTHAWIIQAFCRLPADETWKNKAQLQWEAWIARTSATPRSSSLRYRPCDWAVHNMLRLAARAGQEEWISRIRSLYQLTLSNEPSALAVLTGAGSPKEAVDWLKQYWHTSIYNYEPGLIWNGDIAAGLPAFREACGSPDLALLGEIMLALLPDPQKPDQAAIPGFQDKTKRLVALAKQLPGIKFSDATIRTRCLEYLAQEYETYIPLAKEYDEAAAHTDIAAITAMGNTWHHWHKFKPIRASISRRMIEGDAKPAIEAYDKVLASSNPDQSDKQSAVKELGWDPLWAVPYRLSRIEKPDWHPLLTYVDHLLKTTPKEMIGDHIADAVCLKLIIHHALGEPDAIAQWRKTLTVDQSQTLEKSFGARFELWNLLRDYGGLPKARVPLEQRVALVSALLKDEWVLRRYPDTGTNLQNLMVTLVNRARVFTMDEFVTAWKPIAEAFPRKGKTAAETADLLMQNNRQVEALAAFDLAAAQMQEKEYGTAAGFLYRKAELLERMSRRDEARALLQSFDEKKTGAGIKAQRTAMLKRMDGEK